MKYKSLCVGALIGLIIGLFLAFKIKKTTTEIQTITIPSVRLDTIIQEKIISQTKTIEKIKQNYQTKIDTIYTLDSAQAVLYCGLDKISPQTICAKLISGERDSLIIIHKDSTIQYYRDLVDNKATQIEWLKDTIYKQNKLIAKRAKKLELRKYVALSSHVAASIGLLYIFLKTKK